MDDKQNDVIEISLSDLFDSFKKHFWLMFFLGVLFFGIACFYVFEMVTPQYESTVNMIVSPLNKSGSLDSLTSQLTGSAASDISTEVKLITSTSNIKNALALLDLNKYTTKGKEPVTYKEFYSLKTNLDKIGNKITVSSDGKTRNVSITVKDADVCFAADFANALATAYKSYLALLARDSRTAQRQTLELQIPDNEEALKQAREILANFNAEYGTSQIQSKIALLNPQISLFQLQKGPLKVELEKNMELVPSYFLVTVPKDEQVKHLLDEYRGALREFLLYNNISADTSADRILSLSNDLESKSQAIYSAVLEVTGSYEVSKPLSDYLKGSARYDVLTELEEEYVEEIASYQDIIIRLQELESNVAVSEQLVFSLKQMLEETKVMESSVESNVIIVDEAEIPEKPVSPRKALTAFVSAVVGALIGFALGLVQDLSDTTIKSESVVREILGEEVTALGWIPYAKALKNNSTLFVADDPNGYTSERYRILASNISLVTERKNWKVFTICSTDRSEGKSTVTINTASNFAILGKKVLIVDGDLRRPEMENYFSIAHSKHGLADIVMGNATKEQVIVRPCEKFPTLHLLPAGNGISNPNLVFNSDRFKNLISELKESYDYIFIDCPPLSFGSDFMLLSRFVDAYVLNVRAGSTTKPNLIDFEKQRKTITAPLMGYIFYGRILNHSKGGYGYGYGYGYSSYSYDSSDKKKKSNTKDSYRRIIKKELSAREKHQVIHNAIQAPLAYEEAKPVTEKKPKAKAPVKQVVKQNLPDQEEKKEEQKPSHEDDKPIIL